MLSKIFMPVLIVVIGYASLASADPTLHKEVKVVSISCSAGSIFDSNLVIEEQEIPAGKSFKPTLVLEMSLEKCQGFMAKYGSHLACRSQKVTADVYSAVTGKVDLFDHEDNVSIDGKPCAEKK